MKRTLRGCGAGGAWEQESDASRQAANASIIRLGTGHFIISWIGISCVDGQLHMTAGIILGEDSSVGLNEAADSIHTDFEPYKGA